MHDPFRWPPPQARCGVRGRWWFVAALLAVACGWLRLAPIPETAPLDVRVAAPDDPESTAVAARLAAALEGQQGVASVVVETIPVGETCEATVGHVVADSPRRPVALLLVNPVGGDDSAAAARLGAQARRAGVSIGAVAERPESAPGISILLPSRWAALTDGPTRPPGDGAVVMIAAKGLHRLEAPVEIVLRGPAHDSWNNKMLEKLIDSEQANVSARPDGSVAVVLKRGSQPVAAPGGLLLYVPLGDAGVPAGTPWIEAELRSAGRTIAIDRWHPATRPPKVLLVPALAMSSAGPKVAAATPQDAAELGPHRGAPWSLLQRAAKPVGLVTVWPASHDVALGTARATALANAGAIRGTLPSKEELAEFHAVVIDASLPVGLTRERTPGPAGVPQLAGGLLPGASFHAEDIAKFQKALGEYVADGGTVVLVGANVFAWEKAPNTLRALVESCDPRLASFKPTKGRSRWVFGIDNSESMSSAGKAPLGTLPPLCAEDAAPVDYSPEVAAQYEQLTGRPVFPADGKLEPPTRHALARSLFAGLYSSGANMLDTEADNIASDLLLDTPAELAHAAVDHLLAVFGHPELQPEVNGRPTFRRAEGRAAPPLGEPPDWTAAHPFLGSEEMRDRFATYFDRPHALTLRPSRASPASTCMEWAMYRDYLLTCVFAPDQPRAVAWGFFDASDTGRDGSKTGGSKTVWRIVDSSGTKAPLLERHLPAVSGELPADRARNLFFFTLKKDVALPADAPTGQLLDLSPPANGAERSLMRRLLWHGRGRWLKLLESRAARDLANLRCRTTPAADGNLAAAGATPEVIDLFRRVVHADLRPAFATPYRPMSSDWTVLAETMAGDPLAAVAPVGRGRIVLALVEPLHDRRLDERLRDPARGWVDFSACMLPPTATSPGEKLPVAFRLACTGTEYEITALSVRPNQGWPLIAGPDLVSGSFPCKVLLHAGPDAPKEMAQFDDSVETALDKPWKVPVHKFAKEAASLGPDAEPLLEIAIDVGKGRTSVFAPLPKSAINRPVDDDVGNVSPANRLVDLLLEAYARKPRWRVERIVGRRTLRVTRAAAGDGSPPQLHMLAAGAELPADAWTLDDSLPDQWLVRMPATTAWTGSTVEVHIFAGGPSGRDEVHFVDGFSSDEVEKPLRLTPAQAAEARPAPQSGILDALARATGPAAPPAEAVDAAAYRGVVDAAFDGSDQTNRKLDEFARRFVALRATTRSARYWYLIALTLAVVGIAVRRRPAPGGWSDDPLRESR